MNLPSRPGLFLYLETPWKVQTPRGENAVQNVRPIGDNPVDSEIDHFFNLPVVEFGAFLFRPPPDDDVESLWSSRF